MCKGSGQCEHEGLICSVGADGPAQQLVLPQQEALPPHLPSTAAPAEEEKVKAKEEESDDDIGSGMKPLL